MGYVGQNTKRKARAAVRRKTALALRVEQGLTYEEIGLALGITKQSVSNLLQQELAELAESRRELAGYELDAELDRCDFVIHGMAPGVASGDPMAAQAYLRALERRAKLLGLDAPEKHHHSGTLHTDPTALHARLGAIAARAAREADADAAREAEPDREG